MKHFWSDWAFRPIMCVHVNVATASFLHLIFSRTVNIHDKCLFACSIIKAKYAVKFHRSMSYSYALWPHKHHSTLVSWILSAPSAVVGTEPRLGKQGCKLDIIVLGYNVKRHYKHVTLRAEGCCSLCLLSTLVFLYLFSGLHSCCSVWCINASGFVSEVSGKAQLQSGKCPSMCLFPGNPVQ